MLAKQLVAVFMGLVWSTQVFGTQTVYHGRFEQVMVQSGDEQCAAFFEPREFTVRHFLVGPSGLTSVLFFVNEERGGWLEGRRFVGRYDHYEIYAEETIEDHQWRYEVISHGLMDREVLLVDVEIVAYDKELNSERCQVVGEFSGFSR